MPSLDCAEMAKTSSKIPLCDWTIRFSDPTEALEKNPDAALVLSPVHTFLTENLQILATFKNLDRQRMSQHIKSWFLLAYKLLNLSLSSHILL